MSITVQLFTWAGKKTWDAYNYEERKENSIYSMLKMYNRVIGEKLNCDFVFRVVFHAAFMGGKQ